jgi:hypothetical protein
MATANSTLTEVVSTTLRNHQKSFADNVSYHNALYYKMQKGGRIREVGGGYELVEPLDYAQNSTYQRYSGLDVLNIGSSEVLSAAKYDWKQASIAVVISGLEMRQNSGREQIINLIESRITNAKRTASNALSGDLYSAGSLTNQMGGIQNIIQDAGTGTVGGINSSTYTFWKNQFQEAAGTVSVTTIRKEMMNLWVKVVRGQDKPNTIVSSTELFNLYWSSLAELQRFGDVEAGDTGFDTLKFKGVDVFHDTLESGIPATHMYFINTDYLKLCVHKDANWTPMDERVPLQQDALVKLMFWQGNLVCSNRARQGVLIDAS